MITNLLIFVVLMLVGIVTLDYFLAKRRPRLSSTFAFVGYSLLIGIPVFMSTIYNLANVDTRSRVVYGLIALIVLIPSLGRLWWYSLKKRIPAYQPILVTLAISGPVSVPLFPAGTLIGWQNLSMVFLVIFFYQIWKYPYLNDTWMINLIYDIAGKRETTGRYSVKPVTIRKGLNKRFVIAGGGISMMFKMDHVICRMSKGVHQKLGEPNLEKLFNEVVTEIISYQEKKEKLSD